MIINTVVVFLFKTNVTKTEKQITRKKKHYLFLNIFCNIVGCVWEGAPCGGSGVEQWCSSVPLSGGLDRDPPALDLAQLRVGRLNLEGQPGDPHVECQLGAQVPVGEVDRHPHPALHLLAVDEDVVAPVRHLRGKGREGKGMEGRRRSAAGI